jgi:hypothetical protein
MSAGCELCAARGALTVAMLRVAWSERRTIVAACPACAARAWRTIGDEVAPAPGYAAPGRNPFPGARMREGE